MKEQPRTPSTDPLVEHLIQELQKQGVTCDTAHNINQRRRNGKLTPRKRR
jgi:predicted flavoprotein YhiN